MCFFQQIAKKSVNVLRFPEDFCLSLISIEKDWEVVWMIEVFVTRFDHKICKYSRMHFTSLEDPGWR